MAKTKLELVWTDEELSKTAEDILSEVDYDIYKEDLEERNILGSIENILRNVEVTIGGDLSE
tara:strand:- start:1582 stop:1767 length:186 start_codon:yes stop_codon:yes gene_type:complete